MKVKISYIIKIIEKERNKGEGTSFPTPKKLNKKYVERRQNGRKQKEKRKSEDSKKRWGKVGGGKEMRPCDRRKTEIKDKGDRMMAKET